MPANPKTPAKRSSRLNGGKRTPLSPSISHGMSNLSLGSTSPKKSSKRRSKSKSTKKKPRVYDMIVKTKTGEDTSNPFICTSDIPRKRTQSLSESLNYDFRAALDLSGSRSKPTTPVRKFTEIGSFVVTDELRRQASQGMLTMQEMQSQMDVLKRDYVPPPLEVKRSRSQPNISMRDRVFPRQPEVARGRGDRFIADPEERDICATLELMHLNAKSASPRHTARLIEATGLPVGKRVLSFNERPPVLPPNPLLAEQREYVKPLLRTPSKGSATSIGAASVSKVRKLPTQPERVLDAPGMVDDFYLNLISWSSLNVVAVALGESAYVWRAESGGVNHLSDLPGEAYISSIEFSSDGTFLGIGTSSGMLELWDVETGRRIRNMSAHITQIPSLAWKGHVVSSGGGEGTIIHHDVRVPRHSVMEFVGHHGEICGLKWRPDGELLASGGNDNIVNVWDVRLPVSLTGNEEPEVKTQSRFSKRNHTAAVKALAWCPWQPTLLASGGGTHDAMIHIWNCNTGGRVHSIETPTQVTSLHFAPNKKELLSTHGYPDNSIMIHSYPNLTKIGEIQEAHDSRILFSCIGPSEDLLLTGAADENLKFWRIWDTTKQVKQKYKGNGLDRREGFTIIR